MCETGWDDTQHEQALLNVARLIMKIGLRQINVVHGERVCLTTVMWLRGYVW